MGRGPDTRAGAPRGVYDERRAAREQNAQLWSRRARGLANLRLGIFLTGVAGVWAGLVYGAGALPAFLLGVGLYAAIALAHERARRIEKRMQKATAFYERGIARLENRFAGTGRSGTHYASCDHPYASHLDLFGPGSLFELLSGAQTSAGEAMLARWLLEPAAPSEVRARNDAIRDLRSRLDLREDLAIIGPEVREGLDPDQLRSWGSSASRLAFPVLRGLAAILVGLTLAALTAWAAGFTGGAPFLGCVLAEAIFGLLVQPRVRQVIEEVERPVHDLVVLGSLLERLEKEKFSSSRTREIFECLHAGGIAPSRKIRRLRFVVELLDSRRSQVFVWIAPFLLWTSQCAMAIEAWRIRWGSFLGPWLDSIGELEALLDLAGYAWEHPSDPFPEFVSPGPSFEAEQLGHPLLPEGDCVRNDVVLGASRRLLIVTGSNMSGKSTLLRSIGINAVLAQAGAPVRAGRLRLSPLAIGACVRIVDSLQQGRSRFYAEITTLRGIVALTQSERPVLFVLDELLHGTNSHDRERGGRSVVRGLLERGSIGLVTTHDLALAKIADDLAPQAANVHFADELRDGQLHFDYQLRSGVVEHSNALELMRAVGLEV